MPNNPGLAECLAGLAELCVMSNCTQESHIALKTDDSAWNLMEYRGIQKVCQEYSLELRNCKCGSTLARKIFHTAQSDAKM